MPEPWETLKLLADPTRLRLLRLLHREELSVAELQDVLDMGQSRISSHLSLLRQAELVHDRKAGKRSFYAVRQSLQKPVKTLLHAAIDALHGTSDAEADNAGLERVLERRRRQSEEYFNSVAGRLTKNYCPGRSWEAVGNLLFHLVPFVDIADLGAGEGVISNLLAKRARRVYCIDHAPKMVEVGLEIARRHGIENLEYRLGDLERVPLEDATVDVALLSQALHHAAHPPLALKEAARILRPGGKLLILDLHEHGFDQARELYSDVWLGFAENELYQWMSQAGFVDAEVNVLSKDPEPPHFQTLLATGIKPCHE